MTPPPVIERAREQAQAVERVRELLAAEYDLGWPREAERIMLGAELTQAEKLAINAIAKALSLATDGGWQSIATAPKDGSKVLLWTTTEVGDHETYLESCGGEHFSAVQIGEWGQTYDGAIDWDTQLIGTPTHWMPLPGAPSA